MTSVPYRYVRWDKSQRTIILSLYQVVNTHGLRRFYFPESRTIAIHGKTKSVLFISDPNNPAWDPTTAPAGNAYGGIPIGIYRNPETSIILKVID